MTILNKLSPSAFIPYSDGYLDPPDLYEVDEDPVQPYGIAVFEHSITYQCIHSKLNLPPGGEMKKVKVVGRSKDDDENIIDKYNSNIMLNTMVYDVEFTDITICEYRANLIAKNMYSQFDSEVFSHSILSGIIDFSKDTAAVQKGDQYTTTKSGQRIMRKSTVGWNLLIAWKDSNKQWIPLSVMKESNPI